VKLYNKTSFNGPHDINDFVYNYLSFMAYNDAYNDDVSSTDLRASQRKPVSEKMNGNRCRRS